MFSLIEIVHLVSILVESIVSTSLEFTRPTKSRVQRRLNLAKVFVLHVKKMSNGLFLYIKCRMDGCVANDSHISINSCWGEKELDWNKIIAPCP